jgi:hypothetical protein
VFLPDWSVKSDNFLNKIINLNDMQRDTMTQAPIPSISGITGLAEENHKC